MKQLTETDQRREDSAGDKRKNIADDNCIDKQQKRAEALTKLREWHTQISSRKMDQILPGLFVGGLREAKNVPLLSENGIGAVVSVRGLSPQCHFSQGIALLQLTFSDSPGENIMQHFPAVNSFVHAHRLQNENVLVHCLAGVSRSVCLCLAYLMTVTNLDYPNALDFVCRRHLSAKPNFGFKMQLFKFGQQFVQRERRRLFAEFAHFAGQLRDQFRKDCIFTNSLYVCESSEAIFDEYGTEKEQKRRHENEKKDESLLRPRHFAAVGEDYLGAQKRHDKSANGAEEQSDICCSAEISKLEPSPAEAPAAADGEEGGEGGTTAAPGGGDKCPPGRRAAKDKATIEKEDGKPCRQLYHF